jgi:hypothetical protein
MTLRIVLALALALPAPPLAAQLAPIGVIDFYGLNRVPRSEVLDALGLAPGDSVPGRDNPVVGRLKAIPGVVDARLNAVCCEDGKTILYVGIVESGAPTFSWNPAPRGSAALPDSIRLLGARFEDALWDGLRQGDAAEDDSAGHALVHYPPARAIQLRFPAIADTRLDLLRTVLHTSSQAEDRALAAQIIAYARVKAAVIADLVTATRDPNETVRNNAIRALGVMAAAQIPLAVPPETFMGLMRSPEWTDRNKASLVLMRLSQSRDPGLMAALRSILPELVEMARWQSMGHAAPALLVLGRLGGMTEEQLGEAWQRGDREAIIGSVR